MVKRIIPDEIPFSIDFREDPNILPGSTFSVSQNTPSDHNFVDQSVNNSNFNEQIVQSEPHSYQQNQQNVIKSNNNQQFVKQPTYQPHNGTYVDNFPDNDEGIVPGMVNNVPTAVSQHSSFVHKNISPNTSDSHNNTSSVKPSVKFMSWSSSNVDDLDEQIVNDNGWRKYLTAGGALLGLYFLIL